MILLSEENRISGNSYTYINMIWNVDLNNPGVAVTTQHLLDMKDDTGYNSAQCFDLRILDLPFGALAAWDNG